ncbi:MAG: tetratricopeptide repeat protein, partial [Chloroflexi bacterium]|nr:tetratricopeptide repeat protein [Chloroflexota bacterium]
RGEGWGRPLMEAMAAGLPSIGTRWSAHLEFMRDDNAYLIDCQVVEVPKYAWLETPAFLHHRWAEPSAAHLRQLMRRVFEDRAEARRKGQAAREHVCAQFSRERVAGLVAERLRAIDDQVCRRGGLPGPQRGRRARSPAPPQLSGTPKTPPEGTRPPLDSPRVRGADPGRPLAIVWEGGQFVYHSLALVNRELCLGMIAAGQELSLLPTGGEQLGPEADPHFAALAARVRAPLGRPPDVHLRHGWPPDFVPPPAGRWLMIQPWEYGVVPHDWVDPIERMLDEVWVPSSYVREAFIAGGVSPERVAVVPNGVDLHRFRPDAAPRALPTERRCKLLFVGGTVLWRKGVDVLLKAYRAAFSRRDDVCLVLKDIGRGRLYSGDIDGLLEAFRRDPAAPELLYLTDTIGEAEMPGLYTACDALVLPFRGEGYGLPVAEALACGRPVVVTRGGACDDFCPDAATYWVPAQRARCELPWATARPAWVLEPDSAALAAHLRAVYERPAEARARGQAGAAHARRSLGWDHAIRAALARLDELRRQPPRRERSVVGIGGAPASAELTKVEVVKSMHLARAHARSRHWQAAARALARALDLDPSLAEAHDLLATVEMQRGAVDRAAAAARRAVELAPERADFHTTLGAVLRASGDRRGAAAAYQRALALDGGWGEVWQALAALHAEEGREAEARAARERAARLGVAPAAAPSAAAAAGALAAFEAGRAHAEAGHWDAAARELSRAVNLDPLLAAAHYLLGYVALQRGEPAQAVAALRQAVELAPDEADFQSALGVALHQAGEPAGAEEALRRAVQLDAARGDVWGNLGELHEAQERWADAAAAYERAHALGDERGAPGLARARGRLACA